MGMKKKLLMTLFSVLALGILVACSSSGSSSSKGVTDDNPDKGLEVIGDKITFDGNKLVNDGKPIELEYWTWGETDPVITMAKEYEEIYPNVTIKTVIQPWDDFWTKLPLSLKGKNGPAVFNIHNSKHDLIMPYLEAYDIPVEDLQADFTSVEPHIIDGNVYYTDSVINTGNMYYNKTLWEEAGLTEADIPTTWDDLREVAKKLTKMDGDKITQAGFNYNGETYSALYQGLNYQKGELLFTEDGTVANFDNQTTIENTKFMVDLYEVDKVGSKDFGDDSTMSFGNGQSAIVYKWGWMVGELASKYPEIEYGVFATPTPTADVPFAYDRFNGESTPGINKNQTPEQREVAQDFIRFVLANDKYSKEAALSMASFPTKRSLATDTDILADPVLSVLAPRVERLIWPGPFPSTVETSAKQSMEDILFNGKEIESSIKEGQEKMNQDMKNTEFQSLEDSYLFIDEVK